ncbi:isoprenoid synthase domain-containing protein [Crucibulum laeve]|uniref:Isoprenoid synthase domain-containing protein n=1 Tax=Crucibulum laeve TaxID=68775 RepID=A0A5C3M1X6_9AGAR|nr:isoprenoid synthase domain-containing protein [Crucibulum laeve]
MNFRREKYYVDLTDLFHVVTYLTEIDQLVDLITAPEDSVDLDKFSLERRHLIVIYKTVYYSFYPPVALAMYMSDSPESYNAPSPSSSSLSQSETVHPYALAQSILILIPLDEYFQIQDDWLNFSATPEQIGKVGTDIVDNKCSWVINTALTLAIPSKGGCWIRELKVGERYAAYAEKVVGELKERIGKIQEVEGGLRREVFEGFLGKIYRRCN